MEGPEVTVERDVSTGGSKPKTTGVLKPYKIGEESVRLLPRSTGSAMDRGEKARKVQSRSKHGRIVRGGIEQVAPASV